MSTAASVCPARIETHQQRDQWKDMAGAGDVVGALGRIDRHRDGVGAIVSGDAGGDALLGFDRDGEGRAVTRAIVGGHGREPKRLGTFVRDRNADQSARVHRHEEIDLSRSRELRGNDDVAFILAILGIDNDEGTTFARFGKRGHRSMRSYPQSPRLALSAPAAWLGGRT